MDEDFERMLNVVADHERLCDACRYQHGYCAGFAMGPNGPLYPPCADKNPENYVDEDLLQEIYREITEDE